MSYLKNKKWLLSLLGIFVVLFLAVPFIMVGKVSAATSSYLATPFNEIPGLYTPSGDIFYDVGAKDGHLYSIPTSACSATTVNSINVTFDTIDMEGVVGDDGVLVRTDTPAIFLPNYPTETTTQTALTADSYSSNFIVLSATDMVAQSNGSYSYKIKPSTGMTMSDLSKVILIISGENTTDADGFSFSQPNITVDYDSSACSNAAPIATPDAQSTKSGQPVTVSPLTNDSDADNDSLTISNTVISSGDNGGKVVVNPDGTITYTPSAGFSGQTVITYTIDDGNGHTSTATITITVTGDIAAVALPKTGDSQTLLLAVSGLLIMISMLVLPRKSTFKAH